MPNDAAPLPVEVLSAAEAGARDARTIAAGAPPRALMQRAAAAAAGEITRRYGALARARGVALFAGTGNNGGDAWALAGMLGRLGLQARVAALGEPRTPEARAERDDAAPFVQAGDPEGGEGVAVDGILGIGAAGPPHGPAAAAVARVNGYRARGARVVALDLPSGVDATTGAASDAVVADLTVTFGAMKRGLLVARGHAGRIVVVDVGFAPPDGPPTAPVLLTGRWVRARLPAIPVDAHKGVRRHLLVVGGGAGMAGAAVLAARAALASGAGIVKIAAAPESVAAVQQLVPEALAAAWPYDAAAAGALVSGWPHALLVGPGLGNTPRTRRLVEELLTAWRGPVVLDADALNAFAGDAHALRDLLGGRAALLTPHVAEFARLAGGSAADALARRFDVGAELAERVGATVLLKGIPTVVSGADGARLVSATGTAALGTGGSGDLLGGVAATLLAQSGDALAAGALAAWTHGRAAEIATRGRPVRGVPLRRVLAALGRAWPTGTPTPRYPVLATVRAVGRAGRPG